MYNVKSGKSNCRYHLRQEHGAIYDQTVQEKGWDYPLSTEKPGNKTTAGELRKRAVPHYTIESFIEYLVRFIVADDQVSKFFTSLTHALTPHIFLADSCCRMS